MNDAIYSTAALLAYDMLVALGQNVSDILLDGEGYPLASDLDALCGRLASLPSSKQTLEEVKEGFLSEAREML